MMHARVWRILIGASLFLPVESIGAQSPAIRVVLLGTDDPIRPSIASAPPRWWKPVGNSCCSTPAARFTGTIASDGRTIVSRGELSRDGEHWEPDLALTYTRMK